MEEDDALQPMEEVRLRHLVTPRPRRARRPPTERAAARVRSPDRRRLRQPLPRHRLVGAQLAEGVQHLPLRAREREAVRAARLERVTREPPEREADAAGLGGAEGGGDGGRGGGDRQRGAPPGARGGALRTRGGRRRNAVPCASRPPPPCTARRTSRRPNRGRVRRRRRSRRGARCADPRRSGASSSRRRDFCTASGAPTPTAA